MGPRHIIPVVLGHLHVAEGHVTAVAHARKVHEGEIWRALHTRAERLQTVDAVACEFPSVRGTSIAVLEGIIPLEAHLEFVQKLRAEDVIPARGHVLTTIEDRIAEAWKGGVSGGRIGDVRLRKEVAAKNAVLGTQVMIEAQAELVIRTVPRCLVHEIRVTGTIRFRKSCQHLLGNGIDIGDVVPRYGITDQNRGTGIPGPGRASVKMLAARIEELAGIEVQVRRSTRAT